MRTCQNGDQIILQQQVSFIATDVCGNSDTTTAQFLVVDDLAPIISECPVDTTISTATDTCIADFWIRKPMVSDECSADTLTFPGLEFSYRLNTDTLVVLDGDSIMIQLPLGTNMFTYYVTDCGGNQDSCNFSVTVEDLVAPICDIISKHISA